MATTTPNFGLRKPAGSDNVDVTLDIGGNMDKIDKLLAARSMGGVNGLLQNAWYSTPPGNRQSNFAPGNNPRAVPLILNAETTIDEFALWVDTNGNNGNTCLLAVYNDTGRFYPGSKIHGNYSVPLKFGQAAEGQAGTAVASDIEITPITLGPGVFWLALVPAQTTPWTTTKVSTQQFNLAADNVIDALNTTVCGYRDLNSTNSLPATWPSQINGGSNMPIVAFHVQAAA
jgi:hypothetical protein